MATKDSELVYVRKVEVVATFNYPTEPRREKNEYKTGVINDLLGQTNSFAGSEHCFRLFCFAII